MEGVIIQIFKSEDVEPDECVSLSLSFFHSLFVLKNEGLILMFSFFLQKEN